MDCWESIRSEWGIRRENYLRPDNRDETSQTRWDSARLVLASDWSLGSGPDLWLAAGPGNTRHLVTGSQAGDNQSAKPQSVYTSQGSGRPGKCENLLSRWVSRWFLMSLAMVLRYFLRVRLDEQSRSLIKIRVSVWNVCQSVWITKQPHWAEIILQSYSAVQFRQSIFFCDLMFKTNREQLGYIYAGPCSFDINGSVVTTPG